MTALALFLLSAAAALVVISLYLLCQAVWAIVRELRQIAFGVAALVQLIAARELDDEPPVVLVGRFHGMSRPERN